MILQCLLNTCHAPPVKCISDDEMIGCSQEDQPDEDADWRHNDGFEKPGCGRYRTYIAISDGRDGHCCEIKNVDEADLAIHTIVKAVRSDKHTSDLQSLMRISFPVFGYKQKNMCTTHNN